jgi:hypothetical protein
VALQVSRGWGGSSSSSSGSSHASSAYLRGAVKGAYVGCSEHAQPSGQEQLVALQVCGGSSSSSSNSSADQQRKCPDLCGRVGRGKSHRASAVNC